MKEPICILGAGMTGLAAAYATGAPVYEAQNRPGGICSSYYMIPGIQGRLARPPEDVSAYRFEHGGGHWIFGGDPELEVFLSRFGPLRRYERNSQVLLPASRTCIPYPLQYHLGYLSETQAQQALSEMQDGGTATTETMKAWVKARFGSTLGQLFFNGFQERYTAGLWSEIAPQDYYKTPVDLKLAAQGAAGKVPAAGYNASFIYPERGLDAVARGLSEEVDVRFGKEVTGIDLEKHQISFRDGEKRSYERLISTLPLHEMARLSQLPLTQPADPFTSVLVLNIGGRPGKNLPDAQWIYVSDSKAGFHRVGIYSNVDSTFVPHHDGTERVSFYIESAERGGQRVSETDREVYIGAVIEELKGWGYLESVEVVDPTWIEVAYTWTWPGSTWREETLKALEKHDVFMRGRYGRWQFQGIAASINEGLAAADLLH